MLENLTSKLVPLFAPTPKAKESVESRKLN